MSSRIYTVANGKHVRLVRASTAAQALRHVARDVYTVAVSSQDDLVRHVGDGVVVEDARADEESVA